MTSLETRAVIGFQQDTPILNRTLLAIYLEYMPWFSPLYNEVLEFRDGKAIVPERPGWGFTFNAGYIKKLNEHG